MPWSGVGELRHPIYHAPSMRATRLRALAATNIKNALLAQPTVIGIRIAQQVKCSNHLNGQTEQLMQANMHGIHMKNNQNYTHDKRWQIRRC